MRKGTKILSLVISFLFLCITIYAQQKVKGTITDATGETLPGVTVSIKGNQAVGTVTDLDGNYTLTIPEGAKSLVVTYLGMRAQEAAIKGDIMNFVMEDADSVLDEVVVIGYGTVKRRDLTGSVSSVQGAAIQAIPVSNVAEAITGRLAGVQITSTEGSPDAEIKIRVRGGGSITQDNTPLYIVDGFPVQSISDIPSSEIESIDVLKDASSTAIYGSRGANGVIIITTKSGKEGKFTVSYNAYFGVKHIAKKLDVLSVPDYLNWQYEYALLKNNGKADTYEQHFGSYEDMDLYSSFKGNDWQDQIYGRTGHVFSHNVNMSGGTEKLTYAFNYAHIKDKAIMHGSDFKRDNLSLKLKHKPFKNLTIDYSVRFSDALINGGGMNEQDEKSSSDPRLKHSVIYTPIPANFEGEGVDEDNNTADLVNPYRAIADTERRQKRRTLNLAGGVTWKPISDLTLKTDLGIDYYDATDNKFYGTSTYYVRNITTGEAKPAIALGKTTRQTFRNSNTANYDFKSVFGKNSPHSASVLVGHELYIRENKELTNIAIEFPKSWTASDAFHRPTQGKPLSINEHYSPDDKLVSFFARANYDYMSKYILTATFRADGSSKFSEDNYWGYFPSVAAAWRVSSEKFMEGTKNWLDDLKLRLSYGTAGNNNIPADQTDPFLYSSTTTWIEGISNYWAPSKIFFNKDLKWETTHTKNLGIDFTLFNSKLNGSVELYMNNTKDLLNLFPIPGSGYDAQYRNMGETENKGVELQLNYAVLNTKDYGFDVSFNIGFNKNKIKSLGSLNSYFESSTWNSDITNDYLIAAGGSVGQMYGYRSAGRYELSDFDRYDEASKKWILKTNEDGEPLIYDSSSLTGDNLRPGNMRLLHGEKEVIGDANPLHTGGFTLNGRYKGFDLSAAFNWSYGNDIYNANKIEYTSTGKYQYRNLITKMDEGNRWSSLMPNGTISNDMDELAALNSNTTMWSPFVGKFIFTDWAVEDGSFLRLNTLTLGYTIPANITKKFFVSNFRVYASAYNVFCITSYSGFDPEVSTRRKTNLTPGVDYSAYPKSRQFLFGANITF